QPGKTEHVRRSMTTQKGEAALFAARWTSPIGTRPGEKSCAPFLRWLVKSGRVRAVPRNRSISVTARPHTLHRSPIDHYNQNNPKVIGLQLPFGHAEWPIVSSS